MILEREIGNRESKSSKNTIYKESRQWVLIYVLIDIGLLYLGVKEQRVDGSYKTEFNRLRCTLIGFERNSLTRILSNQNINKRIYSTINTTPQSLESFSINKPTEEKISTPQAAVFKSSLNPWFITGFTDGDGSFTVSIAKKKTGIG
jgi:hypothetical protein